MTPAGTKGPHSRMAVFWNQLMKRDQKCGLCLMAGLPPEVGEKSWFDLQGFESEKVLTAIRSAGMVCQTIHDDSGVAA